MIGRMKTVTYAFLALALINGIGTLIGLARKGRSVTDKDVRMSAGINLAYAALMLLCALDVLTFSLPRWWIWAATPVGVITVLCGLILSIVAQKELGENFDSTLEPKENGKLVTSGPYHICRHPIMLSYLMLWIGTVMALGYWPMFVGFGFVSVVIMKRVALEELALERRFGEEFIRYRSEVSSIAPFLDPSSKDGRELEEALSFLKN